MQLSDLKDFSKIGEAVDRLSAGSAWFRLSSPADKDDSRKILEGKLRTRGIEDPAAFFDAVERAVRRTGIESPAALYECPPVVDIAHLLIEETLNGLDRQEILARPVATALPPKRGVSSISSPPVPVVIGEGKGVDRIISVSDLPTPVRSY